MSLSETQLRLAVGVGLWTFSGSVMALLFLSLAGPDPFVRVLGVSWSLMLTASMILLWRLGGWRRSITLVLELVTVCAAAGMALDRIEAARESATERALEVVRQSTEYQQAKVACEDAEILVSTLTARLQALPFDWTTSAVFRQPDFPRKSVQISPSPRGDFVKAVLPHERVLHSVAFAFEENDVAVMGDAVDHRGRHLVVGEQGPPF